MVFLQKQVAKVVGDKQYYKYIITIPSLIIKNNNFMGKDEFLVEAYNDRIILRKVSNN